MLSSSKTRKSSMSSGIASGILKKHCSTGLVSAASLHRLTIKLTLTKNPLLELVHFMYTTSHYNNKAHYRVFGRLLGRYA